MKNKRMNKRMVDKELIVTEDLSHVPSLANCLPKYVAQIDMGGCVVMVTKTYTDEQIQHIKEYFGWIVTNL